MKSRQKQGKGKKCFFRNLNNFFKINYMLSRIITEDKAYFPLVIICNVNPFVTNYTSDYLIDLVDHTTSYPPFAYKLFQD